MIKHTGILIVFLIGVFSPLPPTIIVNPTTKECGIYWGGDEYADYFFPPPWKELESSRIETENGIYEWDGKWDSIDTLCEKMGFEYVEGNIAEGRAIKIPGPGVWMIIFFCLIPMIIGIFLLNLFLKKVMDNDEQEMNE